MEVRNNNSRNWRATQGESLLKRLNFKATIRTKSGIKVRSKPEKRIADYLYANGIDFVYEKELRIGNQVYHPDFFLPGYNLYIEFFGWSHIPSYQAKIQKKVDLYSKNNIKCIYLFLKGSRQLEEKLESEIRKFMNPSDGHYAKVSARDESFSPPF